MIIKWMRLASASLHDFKWKREDCAMNLLTCLTLMSS
jgi:hypothetical protein